MRMRPYSITALWASLVVVPAAVHAQTAIRPEPARIEGKTTETRPPEKSDNAPTFPQQTRAPYHASAPFKVTTLIDNLPVTCSVAFLPDRKLLLTERLPGSIRIFDPKGDPNGALSEPVAGVYALMSPGAKDVGVLDLKLDPQFATNPQIFFTFFDY